MKSRTAVVVALLAVLLTGCAAGVEETGSARPVAAASSEAATPASSAPASAAPTLAASSPPQVRTISVAYAGGQVTGTSGREQVRLGEQVVLRFSSDVAEEVHVHGYDLEIALPSGGSAQVPLSATVPGVFEVELHDSGKVLYQLRVA